MLFVVFDDVICEDAEDVIDCVFHVIAPVVLHLLNNTS
tara:strand:+ start:428 stop:541 length:114 start_codon:yes stop_codon:yes gene_type:complete